MRNAMWVGGGITGMGEIPMLGVREKGIAKVIRDIFRNGEQGFFYDPNDLTTMYQDAAGTVPVTGVWQPVGLMLDKSKGLFLGDNLITNGSFKEGTTGWSLTGNAVLVDSSVSLTGGGPSSILRQSIPTVAGKAYMITAKVYDVIGSGLTNENGLAAGFSGTRVFKAVATSTSILFRCFGAVGANSGGKITDIAVREISDKYAYQTTSASRPILRQNPVTGANYLEFDGTDDFLQTSNIDFTSTDKVTSIIAINASASTRCVFETGESVATTDGTFFLFRGDKLQFGARGTVYRLINMDAVAIPEVLVGKADIKNANLSINQNGQPFSTLNQSLGTGNYGNHPLYIGRRGGTSHPFNGHIYSLIGVGRLTTESETAAIEKELAKRVGVAL